MPSAVLDADPHAHLMARLRQPVRIRRWLLPSVLRGGFVGFLLAAGVAGGHFAFRDNQHEVQPKRVLRSAQMSPDHLRHTIGSRGVRTVINLRGCCSEFPWYLDETRVTHDLGVSQEDVCLSAIRLPTPPEVRRLIEVLDRCEYPILFHCRQGVDRTGLAAVIVKLLEPGVGLSVARRQLGIGYGYVPFNGTENMDRFFDLYEEWLNSIQCVHSPELFRHWATVRYRAGACSGTIEKTADFPADARLIARTIHHLRVTVRNTSVREWRFRPGTMQGIYVRYSIVTDDGKTVFQERAGQFDASVAVGESMELTLGIPALPPGQYAIQAELCEGEANSFTQFDVEPFAWSFVVEP